MITTEQIQPEEQQEPRMHPFPVTRALHERLWQHGPSSLTDAELLALLIKSGTKDNNALDIAYTVLHQCGGSILHLAAKRSDQLIEMPGLGRGKATAIAAAMELGRRRHAISPADRPHLSTSIACHEMLKPVLLDLPHEEFWVLYLDRGMRLISRERISSGGLHGTVADPKLIFNRALAHRASGLVLGHNHPSGQLRPSEEDLRLTKKLAEGARILDMQVVDHLIVTDGGYYSFADNGMV